MPYVSDDQRKYFNVHRKELEAKGVNVQEWNDASKGLNLPKKKKGNDIVRSKNKLNHKNKSYGNR